MVHGIHDPEGFESWIADHYDRYPLDFLTDEDEARIRELQPSPFLWFVEIFLAKSDRIAEVGCGPGRATLFLAQEGYDVCAVDISLGSLRLARRRAPETRFVCATNLHLPFPDATFDAVISDGVIHHTPAPLQSFHENVRILKPGGRLYLGVYKRRRYYYYVYTYIGVPVRWLEKRRLGRLLIYATLLPVYYLGHLVKSRGKRTWEGARNFFYDYIITPRSSFHTREEILEWGKETQMRLLCYNPKVGNIHVFVFEKI